MNPPRLSAIPELQALRDRLDLAIAVPSTIDRGEHLELVLLEVARGKRLSALRRGATVAQALSILTDTHNHHEEVRHG